VITLGKLKTYLGIDGGEQDALLSGFLESAKHIVEKVLRGSLDEMEVMPEIVGTAILFICWQMYFHRNSGDFNMREIELTAALMLSDLRKEAF
jgi:hypothetical protein